MLGDGYHIEARLVLWQGDQVNKVPLGAVFRYGAGWAAFVVEGGLARLRPVTVGHPGETEVEIVTGIAAEETVAVHPGDRVKDGARVRSWIVRSAPAAERCCSVVIGPRESRPVCAHRDGAQVLRPRTPPGAPARPDAARFEATARGTPLALRLSSESRR
jgi:hypothetical protein